MIGKTVNNSGKKVSLVAWMSRLISTGLTLLLPLLLSCAPPPSTPIQLTGVWRADDQAYYYIRQLGASVWWAGLGPDHGLTYTNVFRGTIQPVNPNLIRGTWANVPRGTTHLLSGTLNLNIQQSSNGIELRTASQTGGFVPSVWTKVSTPFPDIENSDCDIYCRLAAIERRNQDESLHNHLKVYKDNVTIYGTIYNNYDPPVWPANEEPTYQNFMCGPDEAPDGDFNFLVTYQYWLPTPPDFWTGGTWLNNPWDIRNKLIYEDQQQYFPGADSTIHAEAIMYGKRFVKAPFGSPDCSGNSPTLLPGWMEAGRNSVLLNGRPINNGQATYQEVNSLLEPQLKKGTSVRVRGFLALDCHGAGDWVDVLTDIPRPWKWWNNCDEGDPQTPNVEIHPVYAIDVIQDFFQPRSPYANLTGVWGGNNVDATYYFRQLGDTVWWLGLSSDDGLNDGYTFTTVFQGTIQPDPSLCPGCEKIVGDWADVPLGMRQQSGVSSTAVPSVCLNNRCVSISPFETTTDFQYTNFYNQGGQGPDIRKLYDVIAYCIDTPCQPSTTPTPPP